jgi:uncharacterized protein YegP (UPF0339 family)
MIRHISALAAAIVLSLSSVACVAESDSQTSPQTSPDETQQDEVSRSAYFETFKGLDGKEYFNFMAGNGEGVLRSEGYSSTAARETGINSLLANGIDAHQYALLQASNGEWYFNVKAANGEILGTSEFYPTKSNAERGARTVQALVREARKELRTQAAPTRERFELFTGEDGQTYFRLRAANGEILLGSEGYTTAAAARDGVDAVKTAAATATDFQIFEVDGGYAIRLVAANGETVATGESYTTKSAATRAVARMVDILSGPVSITS